MGICPLLLLRLPPAHFLFGPVDRVDSRLNFHASVKGKQRYISATCGCEVVAIAWRRSFACWVRVMGRGVGHSVGGSVIIDATQDMKA